MSNPAQVEALFFAALEKRTVEERSAFLESACGDDAELRRQVERLLQAHPKVGDFLNNPAPAQLAAALERTEATHAFDSSLRSGDEDNALEFLQPSTRPDSLGRLGHYEMLQVLGRGGFGIVFRAFDEVLQRVVAVKVMAPQIATLSPARKRFVREAQSSAKVRHENVVQVYEVGEQPLPYLTMEFIPGETLQQKLDRNGPLEVPEVVRIGRQIAEGLAAAHACDLIHRDIKPGNILLEGGSHKAKITDFGLARAADDASISQSGIIAGTPMFMAPEQALGQKIDQRADLFSLGSVLYQMASGRPPFRAPSALAVLKRVAEEQPRPIAEIILETPEWLCGIIAKLHAKNPDERFQSAREVADLLADCEAKLKAKQEVKNVFPAAAKRGAMKRLVAATLLLLPVIALTVTEFAGVTQLFRRQAMPDPTKPAGDQTQGSAAWRPLFNGKDFTGWRISKNAPADKYRIDTSEEEPFLSFTNAENLAVTETFGDYHLRLQFRKAGTAPVIAGVAVLATGSAGLSVVFNDRGPYLLGWGGRFQDAKFDGGRLIGGAAFSGNDRLLLPRDRLRAPGQWNDLEIVRQGDSGIVRLNGRPYAAFTGYRVEKTGAELGQTGLSFGAGWGTMQFRRIEIRNINAIPPEMAAK